MREELHREEHINIRASKGDFDLLRGDLSGAIQDFIKKQDIDGLFDVAKELYRRGKNEEAQKVLTEAYKISPKTEKKVDN
jgi:TolA-binding protein